MARFKPFTKLLSILAPIFDQLYLLQLEDYEIGEYVKQIPQNFFKRDLQQEGKLKMTPQIRQLLVIITIINTAMFIPFPANIPMIILISILPIVAPQILVVPAGYVFKLLSILTVSKK